jgi:hypothetical protein
MMPPLSGYAGGEPQMYAPRWIVAGFVFVGASRLTDSSP